MATSSADFQSQVQSGSDQAGAAGPSAQDNWVCVIYSKHPLALCLIKDAVCSDARLRSGVMSYHSVESKLMNGSQDQILVLDTCSVENWAECLDKWRLAGRPVIALVSPELHGRELELQMLYLGAAGVLNFADLASQLPKAIYAVGEGHLWFRRDVLDAYVKQTSVALSRCSSSAHKLTAREKQIMDLLLQGFSNRVIAHSLAISERTIKFHVSNILNVGNRKELCAINRRLAPLCIRSLSTTENKRPVPLVISRNSSRPNGNLG